MRGLVRGPHIIHNSVCIHAGCTIHAYIHKYQSECADRDRESKGRLFCLLLVLSNCPQGSSFTDRIPPAGPMESSLLPTPWLQITRDSIFTSINHSLLLSARAAASSSSLSSSSSSSSSSSFSSASQFPVPVITYTTAIYYARTRFFLRYCYFYTTPIIFILTRIHFIF